MRGSGERQRAPAEADFNYDLDGQAFVPPALANDNNSNDQGNNGSNNNASELHPQHVQRTEELRAHAAAVRQQQAHDNQGEAFPTLRDAAAPSPSSAPLVGWTSGTALQNINGSNRRVGQVTEESFPTLQSNSTSQRNKKKAMKGSIGAARRQFAAMTTAANQPASNWGGGDSAAYVGSVAASPASGGYGNPFSSAMPARQMNRQADLAPDNFPSLGPSSSSARSAASALASRNYQQRTVASAPPPSINSAVDFPSMSSNGRSSTANVSRNMAAAAQNRPKPPPSMNSVEHFPAPPSTKPAAKPKIRDQLLGNANRKMPAQDNVLRANMSSVSSTDAKATLEDMKASLGQKNFKQLKKLTKSFAQEAIAPEGYVDQCAALFEKSYDDPDFWSFLPSLLESCPNQESSKHALKYMNSLKRQKFGSSDSRPSPSFASSAAARATPSQWSAPSSKSSVMRQVIPPPPPPSFGAPRSLTQQVAAGVGRPQTMTSKKKAAWGSGGKATIVRTKAPPGSVAAAAATQGPQGGTATKFMAKQQKQQAKSNTNTNNTQQQKKAKKKKQKNELKDLAFGRS